VRDLLSGRTCVVTGAANGIGRTIAERFVSEGARVLVFDREKPAPFDSSQIRVQLGSVENEAELTSALDAAVEWGGRLDVMVNNAAIQIERTIADTTTEEFDRLVSVNLRGTFIGVREAAARMQLTGGGAIVNVGSVLGVTGDPLLGAYSATKGGVVNLTRAAAVTYGRQGIRVNAVCPGAVATPLTTRTWDLAPDPAAARREMERLYPMGRIVEASEVASAATFLASDMASGVTGALLMVDCGLTAANPEYALIGGLT
jgi:NAD(P)-dependent dehydrogenase (short-subunit alcohol dehydrogenase family)